MSKFQLTTTQYTKNQENLKLNEKKTVSRWLYKDDRNLRVYLTKIFKAAMTKMFNEQFQMHLKQKRKS